MVESPRCHRSEARTVIPGRRVNIVAYGLPVEVELNQLYVVINKLEQIFGEGLVMYKSKDHLFIDDYFKSKLHADAAAEHLHLSIKCQAPNCFWSLKNKPKSI